MEGLATCVRQTRRHLKALETTLAAQSSDQSVFEADAAHMIARALRYHRTQYDFWMQLKLDSFADVPTEEWERLGIMDAESSEPSRTPSATGELRVRRPSTGRDSCWPSMAVTERDGLAVSPCHTASDALCTSLVCQERQLSHCHVGRGSRVSRGVASGGRGGSRRGRRRHTRGHTRQVLNLSDHKALHNHVAHAGS
jgi:hypothetical protein